MSLHSLLNNKTVKNAQYLILGKVLQMAFTLVIGMLTARYLGPANYGLLNYAGAYIAFFTALCTLGICDVLVKEIIDHPGKEGMVLGTTLGLRALSSMLCAFAIIAISMLLDADEPETILVVALSALGMIFHIGGTFDYWFQSRLESKISAASALCAYLISAAYKVYLLIAGKGIAYFAFVSSLDYFCLGLLLFYQYKRHAGGRLCFSMDYAKRLLGKSRHFILMGLMVAIYGQTDKLMLKQMIGETEIGYYATAVSIAGMWCFVLRAIIDSIYPSIMQAQRDGDEALFRRRNLQLYAIIFYLCMFVSCGLTVLAEPLIRLMYGESYLQAVNPLRIVTWYTAFSYLGVAKNAWVVAKDRQRHLFVIYMVSAAINVVLNLVLIPVWGASGAALASLAAQVLTTLGVPFFVKEIRENSVMMLEAIALKGILWGK